MAVTVKASVSAGEPSIGLVPINFLDESTGIGTLISRVLNIYDYNNNLVDTVNMGATLTATYNVSTDGYFSFQEIIVDNTGTYTGTFNFLCISFYVSLYAPAVAALTTYCGDLTGQIYNQSNAQNNRYAALDMASFGQGVIAQQLITRANFLITTPYYA